MSVKSTSKFTPTSESGTVELTFTFDASKLQGRTVVVFEDCLHNGLSVATHADINDKDQSVTVENTSTPTPTPTPPVPTGDAANPIIFIVVGIVALAGVLLLVVYRNSSKKSSEEGENKEEDKKQKEETPKKE